MPAEDQAEWELPRLRSSFSFQDDVNAADDSAAQEIFDVKFYPYNPVGAPPIFAAVGKTHVLVCRLSQTKEKDGNPCEVIKVIRDDDPDAYNCASCWSKDPETGRAWLCVGGRDAKVKVYSVKEGKLVKTLVGHGSGINDLATSPANPLVIASSADDTTVRIWSLSTAHDQQPCLCVFGGEGHSWDVLSVAFHDTGRYVLTAGHDQVINLWTLPDFPDEHLDVPVVLYYPHFSTSEIHSGLVDCVSFFGDLILSRACYEDSIVLWRIEGFDSSDPPPPPAQAPTIYDPSKSTRSAFMPLVSPLRPAQYTRLLQFHAKDCGVQFFMRFKIFHAPDRHPVLAFCNAKSRALFWDMSRLTFFTEFKDSLHNGTPLDRPTWLQVKKASRRTDNAASIRHPPGEKDAMVSASPDPEGATLHGYGPRTLDDWEEKYGTSNTHGVVEPHKVVNIHESSFVGRQVAWSPEGEWCVVVGNGNRTAIFERWANAQLPPRSTA